MAGKNVIELTDANFDAEVLQSKEPVLVDFSATWCGPCKVLAPIVEKIADENAGKYKVGKLDIDDAPRNHDSVTASAASRRSSSSRGARRWTSTSASRTRKRS